MLRFRRAVLTTFVLALSACGDSSNPFSADNPFGGDPPTGTTSGSITARINGVLWTGTPQLSQAQIAFPGTYALSASSLPTNSALNFNLFNIRDIGTYPLGTEASVFGGSVSYVNSALSVWQTPYSGAAGQISITSLTSNRMRGTFSFVAKAAVQRPDSVLTVTEGVFDLPLTRNRTIEPLPTNAGSKFTGTFGGASFAAATVLGVIVSSPTNGPQLTLSVGSSGENGFGLTVRIDNYAGIGSYRFVPSSTNRLITLSRANGTASWTSYDLGSDVIITITSVAGGRAVGTLSGTLGPQLASGATAPVSVSATFDIGIR